MTPGIMVNVTEVCLRAKFHPHLECVLHVVELNVLSVTIHTRDLNALVRPPLC